MARYRHRPLVVEAEQFWPEKRPWPEGIEEADRLEPHWWAANVPGPLYCLQTLEGTVLVLPGDWIVRGVAGERYPCKPDIFEQIYEPEG